MHKGTDIPLRGEARVDAAAVPVNTEESVFLSNGGRCVTCCRGDAIVRDCGIDDDDCSGGGGRGNV
eukprot:47184-Eustigmatos_ZCMA.PRE.1